MKDKLVTIVVPAYNVGVYITQCVMSILNQTHENIELIVVDDGSKDDTGLIIDRIAADDNRMRVIHKQNEGVSAARNSALDIATGDYLVFVDGDDYIAEDYVEYMLSLILREDSDFALSTDCFTYKGEKQTQKETVKILNSNEAIALLLSPRVVVGSTDKIYKRDLFIKNDIRFNTKLFYGEGLNLIMKVAQLSNHIVVGNRKVYYYRKNNMLSATTTFRVDTIINGEKSINDIEKNLINPTEDVLLMLLLHKCMYCMGAVVRIRTNKCKKENIELYRRYLNFVRHNLNKILFSKKVTLYRKLLLLSGCISPYILAKLDVIRRKKIVKNSI